MSAKWNLIPPSEVKTSSTKLEVSTARGIVSSSSAEVGRSVIVTELLEVLGEVPSPSSLEVPVSSSSGMLRSVFTCCAKFVASEVIKSQSFDSLVSVK